MFIPIFNIPRKELKLRKEAVHLFQSIDESLIENLFFIDSVPMEQLVSFTKNHGGDGGDDEEKGNENKSFVLKVHLMDHNKLSLALHPVLGPFVCFMIDHHKDEGQYLEQCNNDNDARNRNTAVCGSNVSLIMEYILSISADTAQIATDAAALCCFELHGKRRKSPRKRKSNHISLPFQKPIQLHNRIPAVE